jgi:hypothetical protein
MSAGRGELCNGRLGEGANSWAVSAVSGWATYHHPLFTWISFVVNNFRHVRLGGRFDPSQFDRERRILSLVFSQHVALAVKKPGLILQPKLRMVHGSVGVKSNQREVEGVVPIAVLCDI